MKSVLISIRPEWCEKIASGEKTVEIRKTRPKLEPPFKVYIYATEPRHKRDFGLCLDDGKVGLIYRWNYEYARIHKIPILSGKVIGEFVCKNIDYWHISHLAFEHDAKIALKGTCLTKEEVEKYIGYEWGKNIWEKPYEFFGWHISDLMIYEEPKELCEFAKPDKCPYNSPIGCTYAGHCYRAGQEKRCGDYVERPPQSWCYVEKGD